MTESPYALALKIALVIEQSTADDIDQAVELLNKHGYDSTLLTYLGALPKKNTYSQNLKKNRPGTKSKPMHQVTSKAVRDLEKTEPEKYLILLEFDKLIRNGKVLDTNDSLKRFGESLDKKFRPRKTRRENISELMSTMARMSHSDIEHRIRPILGMSTHHNRDDYQSLAKYLMSGQKQ